MRDGFALEVLVRFDHGHQEVDYLGFGEAYAGLHAVRDEMIQAGDTLFHLYIPLFATVKLTQFLTDDVASLEFYDAFMGLLTQRLQELDLLLEDGLGVAVDQPYLLDALDIVLVAFVDGLVHGVVALGDEVGDYVVRE